MQKDKHLEVILGVESGHDRRGFGGKRGKRETFGEVKTIDFTESDIKDGIIE